MAGAELSISLSSFSMVLLSLTSLDLNGIPNSFERSTLKRMLPMDVSPAWKRSVSIPNLSVPSTSDAILNMRFWMSVFGGVALPKSIVGTGSFLLSTLLFTLSGMLSSCIVTAGTI